MLLSRKDLVKLTLPVLLEQFLLQAVIILNLVFVSSAGASAVSGVSVIDQVNLFINCAFQIAGIGGSVVIAQLIGQEKRSKVPQVLRQALLLGFLLAAAALLLGTLGNHPLTALLFRNAEPALLENASLYFLISAFSYPFYMLYTVLVFALRGCGNTKETMVISLIQGISNMALAFLFVSRLQLGVLGAGLSILISRILGAFISLFLARHLGLWTLFRELLPARPDKTILKNILRLGLPSGIETMILMATKICIMMFVVHSGTNQLAAIGPTQPGLDMMTLFPLALYYTAPTCVAYAKGCADRETLKHYVYRFIFLSSIASLGSHLLGGLLIEPYLSLFSLPEETISAMRATFRVGILLQGLPWGLAHVIPPAMRGAGDVNFSSVCSALSILLVRLPVSYVLCVLLNMGSLGLYLAMFADFWAKGVANFIYLLRGRWLTKKAVTLEEEKVLAEST